VTGLELERDQLVHLAMRNPILLQEFGRAIDERRDKVQQAKVHERTA
jgi:hypothetical protein